MSKEKYKKLIGCIGDAIAITRRIVGKRKVEFNRFLVRNKFASDTRRLAERIEAGIQKIDYDQFSKICSYFGVSVNRVLDLAVLIKKEKQFVAKNRLTTRGDAFIHRFIMAKRGKIEATIYGETVEA